MGPHHPECPERLDADQRPADQRGTRRADRASSTRPRRRASSSTRACRATTSTTIEAASPRAGMHYLDPDTALNPDSLTAARHARRARWCSRTDLVMRRRVRHRVLRGAPARPSRRRAIARWASACSTTSRSASRTRSAHGLERAAVVDFDVHHGNGTEEIFAGDERVIMTGTFQYPLYPYSGVDPLGPNMHNVPLAPAAAATRFAQAMTRTLPAGARGASAGDHFHLGGLRRAPRGPARQSAADRRRLRLGDRSRIAEVAARHAGGRIVSTLEGGYALRRLAAAPTAHMRALAGLSHSAAQRSGPAATGDLRLPASRRAARRLAMERRQFLRVCTTVAGVAQRARSAMPGPAPSRACTRARSWSTFTASRSRLGRLAARDQLRVQLSLTPATPCFLLNLGRPVAAAGRRVARRRRDLRVERRRRPARTRSLRISAICAHKLAYPTREVSFIRFQSRPLADLRRQRDPLLRRSQRVRSCRGRARGQRARAAAAGGDPARLRRRARRARSARHRRRRAVRRVLPQVRLQARAWSTARARRRLPVGATTVVRELTQYCRQTIQC